MTTVFRYMSLTEMKMLRQGKELENNWNHAELRGTASNAIGFCFGLGDKDAAVKASRWLKGIVTMQRLLVADIDTSYFNQCQGRYPDYSDGKGLEKDTIQDELCRRKITLKYFKNVHWHTCTGLNPNTMLVSLDNVYEPFMNCYLLRKANNIAAQMREQLKQSKGNH